ncbi:FHA domain-containing protein [Microbacterium chocolatum]|uniref:FHA domain-containing protein n=1 Tax=Microbacterium aurantiacum TaxID=162393 RepID=UPI00338DE208
MNPIQPAAGLHRVQSWPRLSAELNDDGTGTLTVNGVTRACAAESVSALRTGMVARAVSYAVRLRRPVRLDVTEGEDSYPLAVRPEGYVQLVDARGFIPPAVGLSIDEGRCRHCRRLQSVSSRSCVQCGIQEPLRVEVPPHERSNANHRSGAGAPRVKKNPLDTPARDGAAAEASSQRISQRASRTADGGGAASARHQPALRLAFGPHHSVIVPRSVVIGRDPLGIDGRHPVAVASPGRQLSRTHAAIDVDATGRIWVTDLGAANGVELLTMSRQHVLATGEPTAIPDGTTLLLGDVECLVRLQWPGSLSYPSDGNHDLR